MAAFFVIFSLKKPHHGFGYDMKHTRIFFFMLVCVAGCASEKSPRVYPDLFNTKLNERAVSKIFFSKTRLFWIHTFKEIASNGYAKEKMLIDKTTLSIYKQGLPKEFALLADSLGITAAKNDTKFYTAFYFFDSDYLDKEANKAFKRMKRMPVSKEVKDAAREARKERRKGEHVD